MKAITCSLLLLLALSTAAQENFAVTDKQKYDLPDTISVSCNLPQYAKENINFATVYLLLEDIQNKRKWTYRYPLVNGKMEAELIVDQSIGAGNYALTFLTRKRFFDIIGVAKNRKNQQLNYSMVAKNEALHTGSVVTGSDGSFTLNNLLFEDTCYFSFAGENNNELNISLVTMLDSSAFKADKQETHFITIGSAAPVTAKERMEYKLDLTAFLARTSLPNVTVKAVKKRKVDLYNDEYSKGLFKNGYSMIFDGIEDKKISQSINIFEFLKSRVPGLQIINKSPSKINDSTNFTSFGGGSNYVLIWRGQAGVDIFLDEFILNELSQSTIDVNDIAMIKVYPPPANLRGVSTNGAIAIYTKRGLYDDVLTARTQFKIFGYTPAEIIWK